MVRLFFVLLGLCPLNWVHAAMVSQTLSYEVNGVPMRSVLVYDDASRTPRPALVLVPNWMGVTDAAVEKAKAIAGDRYVVLVADVYGAEVRPSNAQQAGAAAKAMYDDRQLLRQRARAALSELKAAAESAPIDPQRLGAIGFCFGGATVLELARAGAPVAGVVSFHGNLATSLPAQAGDAIPPMLVLNGADDPLVSAEQIGAFQDEMTAAGADWTFVNYAGAVHCFAEADAASPPACIYHPRNAARAFRAMNDFLAEAFAEH